MASNIELIKVLRDRTGAGLMDCKNALAENGDDIEKSIDWLREKGIAKAAKKAGRIAAEGLTNVKVEGNKACIVEVNAETDFVSKSEPFKKLLNDVTDILFAVEPKCLNCAADAKIGSQTISDLFSEGALKMGEKLSLRRFEIITKTDDESFGAYIHMGGKISVLTVIAKHDDELAKGLAMHIAANNPHFISMDDVSEADKENELNIQIKMAEEDEKLKSKPADLLKKILASKVDAHFAEDTLGKQAYLLSEDGQKVEVVLKNSGNTIKSFTRYLVGEGIEKRVEDFAAEVQKQMN